MSKKKKQQLSQAEIWDDSALIRSWNDALAEYKLYHSIHARGERVEDVLQEIEAQEEGGSGDIPTSTGAAEHVDGIDREMLEDGELDEEDDTSIPRDHSTEKEAPAASSTQARHPQQSAGANVGGSLQREPIMPNALLGKVQDEALKNLMMSWYYAGYYTGLYEGQQHAAQTSAQRPSGDTKEGD
ncbi:hypothetical protein MMC08_001710 [Hypocenomyce scalaris]|nr:hypothetical protein [Hypocenomyce scalaris]